MTTYRTQKIGDDLEMVFSVLYTGSFRGYDSIRLNSQSLPVKKILTTKDDSFFIISYTETVSIILTPEAIAAPTLEVEIASPAGTARKFQIDKKSIESVIKNNNFSC